MVRLKHRYLLAHILYPDPEDSSSSKSLKIADGAPYTVQFHRPSSDRLDGRLLMQMIRKGVAELFGDYGSGMIAGSLQVKYFSPATSTAIIRVSRDHYRLVWAALTFTTRLAKPVDQACIIQVVRVSGTIKKSEEAAIRLARLSIKRAQRHALGGKAAIASGLPQSSQKTVLSDDTPMEDEPGYADGIEDGDDEREEQEDD